MKPIKIRIRKKTKVPTKYQAKHLWRSDWKLVGVIEYSVSIRLFKAIGTGLIETDAQFAKLLYDNYGEGIYSLIAWRKGREGFWSFMKIELTDRGYMRLPKNLTIEEKQKREALAEIRKLIKRTNEIDNENEKLRLRKEIDVLREENQMSKEIIELFRGSVGSTNYLKSLQPMYRFHSYEPYTKKEEVEVDTKEFW